MSFIPATFGQKLGMCIPGVGLYFLNQFDDIQNTAYEKGFRNIHCLVDELIKPVLEQRDSTRNLHLEGRQEIMGEYRTVLSCGCLIQGALSVITAVALASLGGIIATVAAIALGLYGTCMFGFGCWVIYGTLNYPVAPHQTAPQTA